MTGHLVRRVKRLSLHAGDIVLFEFADGLSLIERDALRNHVYRMAHDRGVENVGVLYLPGKLRVRKMPKSVKVAR